MSRHFNATWPEYEKALKAAGVRYTLLQPPGTQHGFNNDATQRYDQVAAQAWYLATKSVHAHGAAKKASIREDAWSLSCIPPLPLVRRTLRIV